MIVYHFPIPVPDFLIRICVWGTLLYRKIRFGYAFRRIKLTQGKYAIVDLDDFEILKQHKWHTRKSGKNAYACRSIKLPTGKRKTISMHRQIINPGELLVDHINRIGLDNRRANLRPATPQQNSWNRITKRGNTGSKYIGVRWNVCHKKWRAGIRHNKKMEYLGYFDIEKDAAKIYDTAAKKYRGDFAVLNFNKESRKSKFDRNLEFLFSTALSAFVRQAWTNCYCKRLELRYNTAFYVPKKGENLKIRVKSEQIRANI